MSADEVGIFLLAAAFSLIKRDKLPLISLISSTFCFHSALLSAVSFAHASTKKMQQGSDCAMTTLVCVAKSVMQYQCPCYSSQVVRIRTCAKGTNSPSAEPRRDGGKTRGRCGTMEKRKSSRGSGGSSTSPLRAIFGSSAFGSSALCAAPLSSVFSLLSSLLPPLSSVFVLLSPLFSLLSSPCRGGLATPRSPLIPLLTSERVSERASE